MPEIIVSKDKKIFNSNQITFKEREIQLKKQEENEAQKKEREKKSPYLRWYQFNKEHSKKVIWLATNYPKAQAILLFLLDQMDEYNALVCSYKVMQDAIGISESTVKRSIKILKENNFIEIYKSGTANIYVINKTLAWSSWGTNYKYAKFDAKIVISESEQEQNKEKTKIKSVKRKEVIIEKEKQEHD